LVLIGTGPTMERPPLELIEYFRKKSIGFEILKSRDAAGTFNFLNQEGRRVMAFLLVPGKTN